MSSDGVPSALMPCLESQRLVPLTKPFSPAFWIKWVRKKRNTKNKRIPAIGFKEELHLEGPSRGGTAVSLGGLIFLDETSTGAFGSFSLFSFASFLSPGLRALKSHRRILRSQGSEGGLAETAGALMAPPRNLSNSLRAAAQRFKCRATIRRSLAESESLK